MTGANGPGVCGAFVRSFGVKGSAPAQFTQPTGMATDGRGRLLVAEAGQLPEAAVRPVGGRRPIRLPGLSEGAGRACAPQSAT